MEKNKEKMSLIHQILKELSEIEEEFTTKKAP